MMSGKHLAIAMVCSLGALWASTAAAQDAPVGSPDQLPPSALRVSDLKEPTPTTTHLPVNAVYNISTLDQRLRETIPGFSRPALGIMTGGQPMPQAWVHVANAGVKTVINLRPRAEIGIRDQAAEVRQAGLQYIEIPVAGPADLNKQNADKLWEAMRASRGAVLIHCSSGNRTGALLALAAHWEAGVDKHEALKLGQAAGLKELAPTVEALLNGQPLPAPAAAPAAGSR